MARRSEGTVYRAVLEYRWVPERDSEYLNHVKGQAFYETVKEGPYNTIGAAKTRITWMKRIYKNRPGFAVEDEYIEKAENWTRV
jgi:hypothetical protein